MTLAPDRALFPRVTRIETATEDLAKARQLCADAERHMAHERDTYAWMLAQNFEDVENALRNGRNSVDGSREVRP